MKKRILVVAAALAALALLTTGAFGTTTCGSFSGSKVQFVAAGSSAQFNTFAYASIDYANALLAANSITGTPQIWSAKNGSGGNVLYLQDTRFGTPDSTSPVDAANMWVVWAPADNNGSNDCYLWVYYSIDSTVGVKDFFAYKKITVPTAATVAAVYPVCLNGSVGCSATNATTYGTGGNVVPGLTDTAALPTTIQTFLTTPPAPSSATSPALPYCGQKATGKSSFYCYFNAGMTDIRPEDALYATNRALSAYNTTNGLAGLGYGTPAACATSSNQGCPIYGSVGTGSVFNVLKFALTGTDPQSKASVPVYGTLSTGASPVVVFVNNADTGTLGFGSKSGGNYVFTNVNHKVLALTEEGTLHCTGDFLADPAGAGQPIQVVQREPLSGTYNTFEFTAVRTLSGSAATTVKQNQISSITWVSDDSSGQEYGNDPTTNNGSGTCLNGSTVPTSRCGNPLYFPTPINGTANSCGAGLKFRAIGTGEAVKATIGVAHSGQPGVPDGLGYAFWGYQNFAPLVTKTNCTEKTGNVTCSSYAGHYLAVDGIDPFWPSTGVPLDGGSAYNLPQCGAIVFGNAADFPCYQIPFTHVNDGSYPFWSLLRLVTFGQSTPTNPAYNTPIGVINTVAYAETEASTGSTQLSDFVGFLSGLTNGGTLDNPSWTGNLSLGVFRSHFKQTGLTINPDNGHYQFDGTTYSACSPTNIPLVGAKKSTPVCWVDAGNDVGGSVLSVQSDLDFIVDFGLNGGALNHPNPVEIYNLHQ